MVFFVLGLVMGAMLRGCSTGAKSQGKAARVQSDTIVRYVPAEIRCGVRCRSHTAYPTQYAAETQSICTTRSAYRAAIPHGSRSTYISQTLLYTAIRSGSVRSFA